MDLTLQRNSYTQEGIFGTIGDFKTLEHAYLDPTLGWIPKVPPGTYKCVLGVHFLHNMTTGFQTYEVTDVQNCTGILFHWGNWNKDSEGCILLGTAREGNMVINSREAFRRFMNMQNWVKEFTLTVLA